MNTGAIPYYFAIEPFVRCETHKCLASIDEAVSIILLEADPLVIETIFRRTR